MNFTGTLADSNYRVTLNHLGITNPSGTPMASDHVLDFFFLNGDANHDRVVDVTDLGILATNWQATGRLRQGDFNYDGHVDVSDLGILATNWQASLRSSGERTFASEDVGAGSPSLSLNNDEGDTMNSSPLWNIDALEPRRLFTFVATGTAGDDLIEVLRTGTARAEYNIVVNGQIVGTTQEGDIRISCLAGNDQVSIPELEALSFNGPAFDIKILGGPGDDTVLEGHGFAGAEVKGGVRLLEQPGEGNDSVVFDMTHPPCSKPDRGNARAHRSDQQHVIRRQYGVEGN